MSKQGKKIVLKGCAMRIVMKMTIFLTVCGVVLAAVSANAATGENFKLLGVGAVISTSPYRGVGQTVQPVPMVVYDVKNFYIRGVEAGYHFYSSDSVTLSVVTAPRFMGYDSGDSDALSGMDKRKMSWDAGLRADVDLPIGEDVKVSVKFVNDVLSRYDGREANVALSKRFKSGYFQLTPSIGARLQSSQMVDYYYGVTSAEAATDRPAYDPGHAVNYFADVMFNFGINKNWIVMTRVGVEFPDSGIRKSPIVGQDVLVTGLVGVARRF
ncbi:MAG TPA: MipA/OmpV family protein [Candidatus Omnitrophota bacterium]|nr:MipA/OmpV family protein [Candidatus Omnitrophota bacterium]